MVYLCLTQLFQTQLEPGTLGVSTCVCKASKSHTTCLFPLPRTRLVLRSMQMISNWYTLGPVNVHTNVRSNTINWCARSVLGAGDKMNNLLPLAVYRLMEKMD